MRRLWPLLRDHAGDVLVLGLVVAEQVVIWTWDVGEPKAAIVAIGLLWSVPLLWRKRFPLAVPLFVGGVIALASFYVPTASRTTSRSSEASSPRGVSGGTMTAVALSRASACSTPSSW